MLIRKAIDKDAKEIVSLLKEVLEIHASIRLDLFKSGTCKYKEEIKRIGCYEITLRIYEGNDTVMSFYKKMGMTTISSYLEFILK